MRTKNKVKPLVLSTEERENIKRLLENDCDYVMSDEVADEFLDSGEVIEVDKWHNIISAGEVNPDIYIVVEGILRCWYKDEDREVTAFFSNIPTIAINFHSYYGDLPSFYNFQSCTPAKLIHITRDAYNSFIRRCPEFAYWNLRIAQHQLFCFEIKRSLNQGKAKDKYLSLVKELPDIMSSVPLQIVASYLGISPQHLSRLRRSLQE